MPQSRGFASFLFFLRAKGLQFAICGLFFTVVTTPSLGQAPPDPVYTLFLTDSSAMPGSPILPVISDAQKPTEPNLTQSFNVTVPNNQCARLVNLVNLAVEIPMDSSIREIEAFFNGQRLKLVDPDSLGRPFTIEDAHSFAPIQIPFNKPLFSVAEVAAGPGTLEVRAFDGNHNSLTSKTIPGLTVVRPPAPIADSQIAAIPHPRIWLTPQRLALVRARRASDPMYQRFWDASVGVGRFIAEYAINQDPYSMAFQNAVYNPEGYIPGLALCSQLGGQSNNPTQAAQCAQAARLMVMRITNDYLTRVRNYGRDTGYDMRDAFRYVALAYDWMHDVFTAAERTQMYTMMAAWLDNYQNGGGYVPYWAENNYYPEYTQALALMSIGTMGESPDAGRMLARLRDKLNNDQTIANQRVCGGDWPEGFNYGPGSELSHLMTYTTLKDIGEDWSADYDFVQPLARTMTYQMSPDFTDLRPYGGYSGIAAHKTEPRLLAALSTLTVDGALASRLFNNASANPNNDFQPGTESETFYEMIFGDMSKTADVSTLPLSYLASGTGRFFSRSSLTDPNAYQVITENVNYYFDHFGYANGDVRLYHGAACLLCPSTYRGPAFNGEEGTAAFSTYMVTFPSTAPYPPVNGTVQYNGRNNQILFTKEAGAYSAVGMRFESSFSPDRYDEVMFNGTFMPLDYMIREVVHVRPGILVVRDLHRQRTVNNSLVGTFHLGPTDTPQDLGNGQYRVGNVNISIFSSVPLAISFTLDRDQSMNPVGQAMHVAVPATTTQVEIVTVISDVGTGVSYSAGVLKLSTNQSVTFANGDVSLSGMTLAPRIPANGVVNAAGFQAGLAVAPGGIAAVFGSNLASQLEGASGLPLPASLGGATLQFNGNIAVPLFFASSAQVNIQVPWELTGPQASLTDTVGAVTSTPATINLAPFSPGIFTTNSSGSGQGAILIAGTALVAAAPGTVPGQNSQPATRGQDILSIYSTGLGDVSNRPASGAPAPSTAPLSTTLAQPTVMIGSVQVASSDILFSGLAPFFVGLYQVNAKVPANAPTGNAVSVVITIGGISSNAATIAVQ